MHDLNGNSYNGMIDLNGCVIGGAGDRCCTFTIVFGNADGHAGLYCLVIRMRYL